MPIVDVENNTITFMPHEMVDLHYLKPGEKHRPLEFVAMGMAKESIRTGQRYDFKEMRQFTFSLMEKLMINYDRPSVTKRLDQFSEEDLLKLRPFAFFLAMLDGNCFAECIEQYTPDAYAIITNSGQQDLDSQLSVMNSSFS